MKKLVSLFCLLCLVFVGCGQKRSFTSKEGRFAINFPGEPKFSTDTVKSEIGNIPINMFLYEKDINEAYMVAYSDYPESHINSNSPRMLLKNAKNGILGNIESKEASESQAMEIDGNPAIFFRAEGKTLHVAYKLMMVKTRLYQVCVMRNFTPPTDESVKNFVDSFILLKD